MNNVGRVCFLGESKEIYKLICIILYHIFLAVLLQRVDFQSKLQPQHIYSKRKWEFLRWTEGKTSMFYILTINYTLFSLSQKANKPLFPPLVTRQFSPDLLYIAENSKEHEVSVHSTVPIPCYGPDHGQQCGVPLALSVHDPGQTCRKTRRRCTCRHPYWSAGRYCNEACS